MTTSTAGAAPSLPQSLALAARDIKLAHSVFALPFAVAAVFLARDPSEPWGATAAKLALVVACMVLARTWAMLVNRIADAKHDAINPRTQRRAVASGALPIQRARALALACAIGFALCCAGFWLLFHNTWPIALAIPVLAWVALYSYTKRFTFLCHLFLGGALAASPIAAAIAVNPESLAHTPALWCIAAMVVVWVAGFDIIYALQDVDFDREHHLFSVPATLGVTPALWISRALHLAALALLLLAARDPRLNTIYLVGLAPVALLLIAEHVVLAKRGQAGLDIAFFTLNGVVSLILGAAIITDALA